MKAAEFAVVAFVWVSGLSQEAEVRLRAGQEKIKVRDFDGAIPDFERVLALNPDEFNARFGLGICYWEKEEFARAQTQFQKVVERVEAVKPGEALPGVHQKLLACALLLEDFDSAVNEATRLINLQPIAEYYYDRALAFRRKGDPRAALADCARALQEDALMTKARVLRAETLLMTGEVTAAMEEYSTAVRLRPSDRRGYLGRAMAHYFLEQWPEALTDLEAARKHNRGQGSDLEDQAATAALAWLVQSRLGNPEAAAEWVKPYQAWLKEVQVDPLKNHLLGGPLHLSGKISEADLLHTAEGAKARKSQARCEANFLIAERMLLRGDPAGARLGFKACVDAGARGSFEYELALRRLKRLGP